MILEAFRQEFCRTSKEEKNIQQQFLQLQCVSNVVAVINIQFLKKRYPTEEPEERKKGKRHFFAIKPIKPKQIQIHLLIQFHPIKFSLFRFLLSRVAFLPRKTIWKRKDDSIAF